MLLLGKYNDMVIFKILKAFWLIEFACVSFSC